MSTDGPRRRIAHNPFHVLGLSAEHGRAEVEREGQKLLGMLAVGLAAATTYDTPLGSFPRTAEMVREAMAELRDPERRLIHEMWARMAAPGAASASGASPGASGDTPGCAAGEEVTEAAPWPEAMTALGWQRRSREGPRDE